MQKLVEGIDYYYQTIDNKKYKVFTEAYHLKRGFCCKNRCKHCPYDFKKSKDN